MRRKFLGLKNYKLPSPKNGPTVDSRTSRHTWELRFTNEEGGLLVIAGLCDFNFTFEHPALGRR